MRLTTTTTMTKQVVPLSSSAITRWSMGKLCEHSRLTRDVAESLVWDVRNRLLRQETVLESIRAVIANVDGEEQYGFPRLPSRRPTDAVRSKNKTEKTTKGIIRATNVDVSIGWRESLEKERNRQQVLPQVSKSLSNLWVLHQDTRRLTEELLVDENGASASNFWHKFASNNESVKQSGPQQTIVAGAMEQIRSRHASTVETMADVLLLLRGAFDSSETDQFEALLESFLRGRLGVQLLCDHYVKLHRYRRPGVTQDCSLADVLDDAVTESKHICDAHYEISPDVLVLDKRLATTAKVTLVRPWVHHALCEILKNAMAATIDHHERQHGSVSIDSSLLPPIEVSLSGVDDHADAVTISVKDRGMGLKGLSSTAEAFKFASSSVAKRWDRLDEQQSYAMVRSPLQSLGVGLSTSQWMMQHFGGDVQLSNNNDLTNGEADGCTASVLLCKDPTILERAP